MTRSLDDKLMTLREAVKLVRDGDVVGCGGFTISKNPIALTHELIRQKKRNLTLVSTNLSMQGDLLVAAGCVKKCICASTGMERFGLLYNLRRSVEQGRLEIEDNSHFGMVCRFIAGELGLPFMPILSYAGSNLVEGKVSSQKFAWIDNPFNSKEKTLVLSAVNPDISIIHVQKIDTLGNAIIDGCLFHEVEMARASKKVIVTAEEIVSSDLIRNRSERTSIPFIYITAIVEQPWGAYPMMVYRYYDYDAEHLNFYQECARAGGEKYEDYLNEYVYGVETFEEFLEKAAGVKKLIKLKKRMLQMI